MKFYTLTLISFQNSNPGATFQSNLLLFSDKCDIIKSTRETQKTFILKHLKETAEVKENKIEQTFLLSTSSDTSLSGYKISIPTTTYYLFINEIEVTKKTKEEKEAALQPGDIVTLKPEALEEAIRQSITDLRNTKIAKITQILQNNKVRIMICANNRNPESTDYMGRTTIVPISWLQKIYV